MRRASLWLAGALALAACSERAPAPTAPDVEPAPVAATPGASPQASGFVPGRVLARFAPGADAPGLAADLGGSVERVLRVGVHVLRVPAGAEARVAQALSRSPAVVFAEPDWIRTFGDPAAIPVDDPFVGYKWDLDNDGNIYDSKGDVLAATGAVDADMDWREAVEQLGAPAASARIGIMDTGIRRTHVEVAGRIAVEYDFFAQDGDATDDHGHGTHVAGIAGAATDNGTGVAGVAFAPGVDFAIAKVCGRTNPGPFGYGCPSSAIADGIVWAVDQGAHVLNLSLGGGGGSETTRSALQYARAADVLPFCAAGNDGGAVSYPAAWPECVAVSSTDWSDGLASYSNFGPQVELAAPGGDDEHPDGYSLILSSYNSSDNGYAWMAGTSMASPQAAGLGALLHVLGLTDDDEILARMKSSADDLGASGVDDLFGAGRINVYNAVNGLTGAGGGGGGTSNQPPAASFTFQCTELTCDLDGTSSHDGDGTVIAYAWEFGDGNSGSGATVSHTYAAAGEYSVTLTVTDDGGATDAATQGVTATAPATGDLLLSAQGRKVRGYHSVDLTWSGATSAQVDLYRDGGLLTTTANDGAYTDATGNRGGGRYEYQLCEAGTATCSDVVAVVF